MSFSDSMESLKNFDINDLDFNNAGSWPLLIKLIVLILVFSLVVGGAYWFLIKDEYESRDRVAAQEIELRKEYEVKAQKVANLQVYRDQMAEMEKTFGELLKQLPGDTEVPGLLEDITSTGLGSGLSINSISLAPEASKEFYVELPINISAKGTYHDLASFISGVASLPRIVTLHDFTLKPIDAINPSVLEMTILAKTYRYKSGG